MIIPARSSWIEAIQARLNQLPLPGVESHLRRAHALRKVEFSAAPPEARQSAVLLILFEKADEWNILLIQRKTGGPKDKHAGQIGLPGGKKDIHDPDLLFTALREANEETGLDLSQVDVLGKLTPMYIPISKFVVNPFVAYTRQNSGWIRQESEIQSILEVPLKELRDPANFIETRIQLDENITINHVPAFAIQDHIIWGATAMILGEWLDFANFEYE